MIQSGKQKGGVRHGQGGFLIQPDLRLILWEISYIINHEW